MSSAIRNLVQKKIAQSVRSTNVCISDVQSNLSSRCDANGDFIFSMPLKTRRFDISGEAKDIARNSQDVFPNVSLNVKGQPAVAFRIPRDALIKEILESNVRGLSPPAILSKRRSIVVEFSSPNIAKPVHVGHLRSTIIGNCLANLHSFLGDEVRKINYLGDWGTQFGYVQLGIDLLNISEEAMTSNPITELYRAYIHANNLSLNDTTIPVRARQIFENLEKGDELLSKKWQNFRGYTTQELEKTYSRLGITFDDYHWESMYGARKIERVIELMERLNILETDDEKRRVVALNENRRVPIVKSDGSTLYLTRDIAAAIDRFEKYKFDIMYYVVDNAQTDHFKCLTTILGKMDMPWAERIHHVKFGKIRGMSTRRGTAIFLEEFLNEARDVMREKQGSTLTTKVSLGDDDNSCDILGMSAVVIYDLKQKRQRDYEFNWNVALDIKGETGVKLQYTHCRLVNLEKNCGTSLPDECHPSLLNEACVNALVAKIVKFDEALILSYETLEPCHLAKYLFDLSHAVNKTLMELRVKDAPTEVASQRLLLFRVARNVLGEGLTLLGLRPLAKM